jgi:dihydroorotate dehydrogenase electron transfer subunit
MTDRVLAPFGRRDCEVVANEATGGYRLLSALDREGPMPRAGQFYMLTGERWGGAAGERPYLPRAFSVAEAEARDTAPQRGRGSADASRGGVRLDFLLEAVGPGTERLAELRPGETLRVTGPLGRPFSRPAELDPESAGAILVGGGIGSAPLAILRRELAELGVPQRVLLGFRDAQHSGGMELFACSEVRTATEDGHAGHQGYVTDLLAVLLEGDDAASAVVYACGPPAMLEAVRTLCGDRGVTAELAMETPMACGFGSCFGCAVPLADGGYMRLCVDGPTVPADRLETALVPGSGH